MPPLKHVVRHERTRVYACAFISGLSLACVGVLLQRQHQGLEVPTHRLLMIASSAFVLSAFAAGALRTTYGRLVVSALLLCWLGDFLGPNHFEWSVTAFLVAHLLLIPAFLLRGIEKSYLLISGLGFAFMSVYLGVWLLPYVPNELKALTIIYMLAITAMVSVACGQRSGPGRLVIFLGAVLFYVSDIFVARWRFVVSDDSNAFYCYPMYYTACLLLAFSILLYDPPQADGE